MKINEQLAQACEKRCSRRAYRSVLIDARQEQAVRAIVSHVNEAGGLHFRFVRDGRNALSSFSASHGMFSGAPSYVTISGPDTQKGREDCGYYGEWVVLECTALDLGTCWVGGSFSAAKVEAEISIPAGETLFAVLAVGAVEDRLTRKEALIYNAMHRKNKPYEVRSADGGAVSLPAAIAAAMIGVENAPSAVNKKPCRFTLDESGVLSVSVDDVLSVKSIDLGIAKLHAEIGLYAAGLQGAWDSCNRLIMKEK